MEVCLFGGIDVLLKYLDPNYVAYIRSFCHLSMKGMHLAILAHLLGFSALKDTNAIMRTCSMWYRATREQTFWKRRIEEQKRTKYAKIRFIDKFDTFCISVEPFVDQVRWLFYKGQSIYQDITCEMYTIVRDSGPNLMYVVFDENGNIYFKAHQQSRVCHTFWYSYGEHVWIKRYIDSDGKFSKREVCRRYQNGDMYEGEGRLVSGEYRMEKVEPHGDGKWTFANGSILEGQGVAWKGEPRKPLKKVKIS